MDHESDTISTVIMENTNDMNRDDGSNQLSHVWDKLLIVIRKLEVSPDGDLSQEVETVCFLVVMQEFYIIIDDNHI